MMELSSYIFHIIPPVNLVAFLLQSYGHLSNKDISLLRTVLNVPTKFSYIFSKKKKKCYNTDSLQYGQRTLNLGPRE